MSGTHDDADSTTNLYLTSPHLGYDMLGLAVSNAVDTGFIDQAENDRLREFLADLQPEPLTKPLSPGQAKRLADPRNGFVTVVLPVALETLVSRTEAGVAEHLGTLLTGSVEDADLIDDVQYEPVAVADGKVLLRVWAYVTTWVAEYVCREEGCYERADEGDSYDGYCPEHADAHYGEEN